MLAGVQRLVILHLMFVGRKTPALESDLLEIGFRTTFPITHSFYPPMKTLRLASVIVAVLGLTGAFQADGATILFRDDFENVSSVSTSPAVDSSGDYDPVATTGLWSLYENVGSIYQVTRAAPGGDPPPAFDGSNSLRNYRDAGAHNPQDAFMRIDAQTRPGDVIRLEMMVYIPSASNHPFRSVFSLIGDQANPYSTFRALASTNGSGLVKAYNGAWMDTSVPYATDVWQQWGLEYAVNAPTFTVSVNGVSQNVTAPTIRGCRSGGIVGRQSEPCRFVLCGRRRHIQFWGSRAGD